MIRSVSIAVCLAAVAGPTFGQQSTAGSQAGRGQNSTTGSQTGQGRGTGTGSQAGQGQGAGIGAQGGQGQGNQTSGQAGVSDSLFAQAAAAGGLAEVTLSELGVRKATSSDLKSFSQRMIDEHTRVNAELKTLATQRRYQLPTTVDARAAFCAQSLMGLSGEEFDRCYAKAQLVVHMDALSMFEAEAERGQDADTRAFAAKVVPHIREHLKTIKPIAMKLNKESESDSQQGGQHNSRDGEQGKGSESRGDKSESRGDK